MSWFCKSCGTNNVNLNLNCVYCRIRNNIIVPREDFEPFDFLDEIISEKRFRLLDKVTGYYMSDLKYSGAVRMSTPQEELFQHFFSNEKVLVKNMSLLELRSHREELSKIAFEARARMTAIDDEENDRKKKSSDGKPTGFSRSVNGDDKATNLINTVKERQKKLTKNEKLEAGLAKLLGGDNRAAAAIMSAGKILAQVKQIKTLEKTEQKSEAKMFNPFEKK